MLNPIQQRDMFDFIYDLGTTLGADQFENVMRYSFESNVNDTSGHDYDGTLEGTGST